MSNFLIRVIILSFVLLVCARSSISATLFVDLNSGNAVAPYSSWATAATNIQDAVDLTLDGDTVLVTNGVYYLSEQITVTNAITVQSVNGPKYTIVDGRRNHRCFYMTTYLCAIKGFTIRNGFSKDSGGGVGSKSYMDALGIKHFLGGQLMDCVFAGNQAYEGGGMCGGTVSNCTFVGNIGFTYGGGVASVSAYRCTLVGNYAVDGGGAFRSSTSHCILWHNISGSGNADYGAFFDCALNSSFRSTGCITDDPMLVSSSHIAVDSPCVGAGNVDYAAGVDIDGEPWKNPPAIGRDEPDGIQDGDIQLDIITLPPKVETGRRVECIALVIGNVTRFTLDFGDGVVYTNALHRIEKAWSTPGVYDVVLTAYNNDFPSGLSHIQHITVGDFEDIAVYVSADGDDANSGESWASAKATILGALDVQGLSYRSVLVSNGVYALDEEVILFKGDRIKSLNGPEHTIVDGCGSNRCFNFYGTDIEVEGFTIRNGYADNGGGVGCLGYIDALGNTFVFGDGTVSECVFSDNVAQQGGGMFFGTANNCRFLGNMAELGGGMYGGVAKSSIFVGNSATEGGGICGSVADSCTITGNTADFGGGIYLGYANNSSIVWHNSAIEGNDIFFWVSLALFSNICSPDVMHGVNGCITNNPWFVDAANGDFRLLPESPCIDAGSNVSALIEFDLDGIPRILDGDANGTAIVDMGCYEFVNSSADSDGDTMTDMWELSKGLNPVIPDGSGNWDFDPFSNVDEFIADTDPNSSNDWFCVTAISNDVLPIVCFQSSSNRLYTLLGCTNLSDGVWHDLIGPRTGIGGSDCFDTSGSEEKMFYKLRVELP